MNRFRQRIWQAPRSVFERDTDRKASFLELFYDLVFVVTIATLTHGLSAHLDLNGILSYIFLFIPVWWAWNNGTFYHDIHGNNDVRDRFFTFLQMFAVAAMAVFIHNGMGETSQAFALAYAAHSAIITFLWWRAHRHEAAMSDIHLYIIWPYFISIVLFVSSVWVDPPWRFVMWGIAMFLSLVGPLKIAKKQNRQIEHQEVAATGITKSLIERFGLFTIIMLGEIIVGVIQGLAEHQPASLDMWALAGLGMLIACGLWWLYFDFTNERPVRSLPWIRMLWTYIHFPITLSIASLGAAMINVVAHPDAPPSLEVRWLLCGSIALALISITILLKTLVTRPEIMTHFRIGSSIMIGSSIVSIGLAIWGTSFSPIPLMSLILALVFIPVFYGIGVWLFFDSED